MGNACTVGYKSAHNYVNTALTHSSKYFYCVKMFMNVFTGNKIAIIKTPYLVRYNKGRRRY